MTISSVSPSQNPYLAGAFQSHKWCPLKRIHIDIRVENVCVFVCLCACVGEGCVETCYLPYLVALYTALDFRAGSSEVLCKLYWLKAPSVTIQQTVRRVAPIALPHLWSHRIPFSFSLLNSYWLMWHFILTICSIFALDIRINYLKSCTQIC